MLPRDALASVHYNNAQFQFACAQCSKKVEKKVVKIQHFYLEVMTLLKTIIRRPNEQFHRETTIFDTAWRELGNQSAGSIGSTLSDRGFYLSHRSTGRISNSNSHWQKIR